MSDEAPWQGYLDRLEAALANIEARTWQELPVAAGLGPLPEELRERTVALLAGLRSAEAVLRLRRSELRKRLEASRGLPGRRSTLAV
jgi:hypothetical protein